MGRLVNADLFLTPDRLVKSEKNVVELMLARRPHDYGGRRFGVRLAVLQPFVSGPGRLRCRRGSPPAVKYLEAGPAVPRPQAETAAQCVPQAMTRHAPNIRALAVRTV
jgi:hypothetical protein